MSDKIYISAQELLEDSFKLGAEILKSGFKPKFIVGIWRGGTPVGIAVQEMLDYFGIETDHIAIRTSLYTGIDERADTIRVHGLNYIIKKIRHDDDLLIVDDVFDTGLTIEAVIEQLSEKTRSNMPEQVRVAVPWFKPSHNKTDRIPDYYIRTTDEWLVFPHEIEVLSEQELRENRPQINEIIEEIAKVS